MNPVPIPESDPNRPQLVFAEPGAGPWTGHTSLTHGHGGLASEVALAAEREQSFQSAVFAEQWVDRVRKLPTERCGRAPLDGYFTAPLPLPFALPVEQNEPPVAALAPWWNLLRLPEHRPELIAEAPRAESALFQTQLGDELVDDPPSHEGLAVSAHLDVSDGAVSVWGRRKFVHERVKASGFTGALIGGALYSGTRDLVSAASRRDLPFTFGCRIPIEFISRINLTVKYSTTIYLAARRDTKERWRERGYSDALSATISIHVFDGWTRHIIGLVGGPYRPDEEQLVIEFTEWLTKWVAHGRASHGDLTDGERTALYAISSGGEKMSRGTHEQLGGLCHTWDLDLPAARPVSVQFASGSMLGR